MPDAEQQRVPPWLAVPAEAMIQQLSNQVTMLVQEMAAMRAYIEQLHHALEQMTKDAMIERTEDNANGTVVPAS